MPGSKQILDFSLEVLQITNKQLSKQIHLSIKGLEKVRLLGKMILDQFEILILDEPTRNFSPLTTPVLCRALKAFDGVIISISHDRRYLHEVAATVYELTSDGLTKIK